MEERFNKNREFGVTWENDFHQDWLAMDAKHSGSDFHGITREDAVMRTRGFDMDIGEGALWHRHAAHADEHHAAKN